MLALMPRAAGRWSRSHANVAIVRRKNNCAGGRDRVPRRCPGATAPGRRTCRPAEPEPCRSGSGEFSACSSLFWAGSLASSLPQRCLIDSASAAGDDRNALARIQGNKALVSPEYGELPSRRVQPGLGQLGGHRVLFRRGLHRQVDRLALGPVATTSAATSGLCRCQRISNVSTSALAKVPSALTTVGSSRRSSSRTILLAVVRVAEARISALC